MQVEDINYTHKEVSNKHLDGLIDNHNSNRWNIDIHKVESRLTRSGVMDNCYLHQGDIKETLPKFLEQHQPTISLLYIDCNAFSPSYLGLKACYPFMESSGIMCIDEHQTGGETYALEKFSGEIGTKIYRTGNKYGTPMYIIKQ